MIERAPRCEVRNFFFRHAGIVLAALWLSSLRGQGVGVARASENGSLPNLNAYWENDNPRNNADEFLCIHINLPNPTEGQGSRNITEDQCHWEAAVCDNPTNECTGAIYSNGTVFIYLDNQEGNSLDLGHDSECELSGDWHHSSHGPETHADMLRQTCNPPPN